MNKEIIRNIKQQFYTFRNGMLGERLRKGGDNHKIIFGLNLPQIISISENIDKSKEIAMELWNNVSTRESQLLAPMIFPIEYLHIDDAKTLIATAPNIEVSDILCHRLLRHAAFAKELCAEYTNSDIDLERYTAMRISMNLLATNKIENLSLLKELAQNEIDRNCNITKHLAISLIEEIEFREEL